MKARKRRSGMMRRKHDVIGFLVDVITNEPRMHEAVRSVCRDMPAKKRSESDNARPAPASPDLTFWRKWLSATRQDEALSRLLLGDNPAEEDALVRLIVRGAHWSTLLEAWEIISNRCGREPRAATPNETLILNGCLAAHNLIWKDTRASEIVVNPGSRYDGKIHRRAGVTGDRVRALLLPGLHNAGGGISLKPLVETE